MAGSKLFVDTNILIHANNIASPFCLHARNKLVQLGSLFDSYWISRQVIREYLVVMTNLMRIAGHVDHAALKNDVDNFLASFHVADFEQFSHSIKVEPLG